MALTAQKVHKYRKTNFFFHPFLYPFFSRNFIIFGMKVIAAFIRRYVNTYASCTFLLFILTKTGGDNVSYHIHKGL